MGHSVDRPLLCQTRTLKGVGSTHSSDITDNNCPAPCQHLPVKPTVRVDSVHCCGLCECPHKTMCYPVSQPQRRIAAAGKFSHCWTTMAVAQPLSVSSERFCKIWCPCSCQKMCVQPLCWLCESSQKHFSSKGRQHEVMHIISSIGVW